MSQPLSQAAVRFYVYLRLTCSILNTRCNHLGKFRKVEAHNMVPHFTVSFAANLPGVLHSLEPRIIGDD